MKNRIDRYMEELYARAPRRLSYRESMAIGMSPDAWRSALMAQFREMMGLKPEETAPRMQITDTRERADHILHRIEYESEPGLMTPAYLLLPKRGEGRRPAVVACTGHGYGVRDIVGIEKDFSERSGGAGYQKDFGIELVRRGFIVLAPEPLGFGEMMLDGDEGNSCGRISSNLLLLGRTMAGARIRQYQAAVSLLCGMEKVDASRIGAMGISGGGLTASFLTILDPRVQALVASGYPCMYEQSIYGMFHCIDNFLPGLLNVAENDDLMGLIAPRPMLWESGSRDPIFPRSGVERAQQGVLQIYRDAQAEERFEVDYFEGEHEISGRRAYDFLLQYLA